MIIKFSPADLKRVSLARKPDPMWEIVLSLRGPAGRRARRRTG